LFIEFGDNVAETKGGKMLVSMMSNRLSLLQKDGQFSEMENHLGDLHFRIHTNLLGSTVSSEALNAFWVKWTDHSASRGPILEIGHAGEDTPFFSHTFGEACFDCVAQDQHGWHGQDVQLPRASRVFKPQFWSLDAVEGNQILALTNCSSVVFNRYQSQPTLGGTCLTREQCTNDCPKDDIGCLARHCRLEASQNLTWTKQKTCQILPKPSIPPEYIVLFLLFAVLLVLILVFLCCLCYFMGTKYPQLRRGQNIKFDLGKDTAEPEGLDISPISFFHHSQQTFDSSFDHSVQT
jgi:hypothetical protein